MRRHRIDLVRLHVIAIRFVGGQVLEKVIVLQQFKILHHSQILVGNRVLTRPPMVALVLQQMRLRYSFVAIQSRLDSDSCCRPKVLILDSDNVFHRTQLFTLLVTKPQPKTRHSQK